MTVVNDGLQVKGEKKEQKETAQLSGLHVTRVSVCVCFQAVLAGHDTWHNL